MKKFMSLLMGAALVFFAGCSSTSAAPTGETGADPSGSVEVIQAPAVQVDEDGSYTAPEEIAAYLNAYGHLPGNFITKQEARDLGWVSREGNLWVVAEGKSIGGDVFSNYEGSLPRKDGRVYYECDANYQGGYRGAERIVYSNDGLVYYTGDHYDTFTLLYGDPES